MEHEINFVPLYSGGSLYLVGQPAPIILDIAGLTLPTAGVPCWLEHSPFMRCGELTKIEIGTNTDGSACVNAYGEFARYPPQDAYYAREIKLKRDQGVRWDASIHTKRPNPLDVEYIPEGQEVQINGRTFVGPCKIFRKWEILEGSFVNVGGDPSNEVEIAASGGVGNHAVIEMEIEYTMDPKILEWIPTVWPELDLANITPEQASVFEHCYNATQGAAATGETPPDGEKKDEPAAAASEDGCAEGEKKDEPAAAASGEAPADGEKKDEPAAAASGDFATRNPARKLAKGRVASTGVAGTPDINDVLTVAMMDALGKSSGEIAASGDFSRKQAAMNEGLSRTYRGMDMRDMFRMAIEKRRGQRYFGALGGDFARECLALMDEDEIRASGDFSTVKPLTILENVFNMQFREGYDKFEGVAEKLSETVQVDNMEEAKIVNYEITGGLTQLAPDGEIPDMTLDSDSLTTQVNQVSGIITLTEVMIINNRFDQFAKIVNKLGMKAKRAKEQLWFKVLGDNLSTLCTSAHGNTMTTALSIAGLDTATEKLSGMTTLGSTTDAPEFTEYEGKYLLIPRALLATAEQLVSDMVSTLSVEGSTANAVFNRKYNGAFEPVASNYFGSRYNSGTDTRFVLMADPSICPAMYISQLRGETGAKIERFPTPPKVLGRTWRCIERYGINTGDYRALVYSTGAGN